MLRRAGMWRGCENPSLIMPLFCGSLVLTYLVFVLISISFLDASTPLDSRIILPVFVFSLIGLVTLTASLSQALGVGYLQWGIMAALFAAIGLNIRLSVPISFDLHMNGQGFTSRQVQTSTTLAVLDSMSDAIVIYSNEPPLVSFQTGRKVSMLPRDTFPLDKEPNPDYVKQLNLLCQNVKEDQAVVIYMFQGRRKYLPTPEQLMADCSLSVLYAAEDGLLLGK